MQNEEPIFIESSSRIVKQAGSTKEADLISTDAFKSIDLRAKAKQENAFRIYKIEALNNFKEELSQYREIHHITNLIPQYCAEYLELISSHAELKTKISQAAKLLALMEVFSKYLSGFVPEVLTLCSSFSLAQNESEAKVGFINIFGDHQGSKGIFAKLADALKAKLGDLGLEIATSFVELAYYNFLITLSISVADHNLMINQLGIFFDQYLNIHEEDYPPYAFHRLSAGEVYGFDNEYYLSNKLREKMFKFSAASGTNIYKLLWKLVSEYTVLQETSQTYRDLLIGDYENGLIPIGYQHQTICIEERFWDCISVKDFRRIFTPEQVSANVIEIRFGVEEIELGNTLTESITSSIGSYMDTRGIKDYNIFVGTPVIRQVDYNPILFALGGGFLALALGIIIAAKRQHYWEK